MILQLEGLQVISILDQLLQDLILKVSKCQVLVNIINQSMFNLKKKYKILASIVAQKNKFKFECPTNWVQEAMNYIRKIYLQDQKILL
jgi:hypothetical protein